jgi:RNA polymerase sigma-70 factor (ECF subfamily)
MTVGHASAPGELSVPSTDGLAARAREALAAGDRIAACEAFDAVVAKLQRRALRVAFWYLRDPVEAEDAVQDAFLRTFEHLDRYRPDLPFDAWFLRVLVNGCLDRLKARSRRQRRVVPEEPGVLALAPADPRGSPEAGAIARQRRRALLEAIERLPQRQREVVVLGQLEGMSSAEIGEVAGLSESTVRVHLFRALRKLRGILTEPAAAGDGEPAERRARR